MNNDDARKAISEHERQRLILLNEYESNVHKDANRKREIVALIYIVATIALLMGGAMAAAVHASLACLFSIVHWAVLRKPIKNEDMITTFGMKRELIAHYSFILTMFFGVAAVISGIIWLVWA